MKASEILTELYSLDENLRKISKAFDRAIDYSDGLPFENISYESVASQKDVDFWSDTLGVEEGDYIVTVEGLDNDGKKIVKKLVKDARLPSGWKVREIKHIGSDAYIVVGS